MKKNLIMSTAISIILLTALTAVVDLVPLVSAYPSSNCVCDHWYVPDENTANDIFTATGLDGNDVGDHFSSVYAVFAAGSGGNYIPLAYSSLVCNYKYQDSNWNWQQYVYYSGTNWYNADPFPSDGTNYVYAYYRQYTPTYTYSYMRRFKGETQNWFQNPSNPSTYVLIGSTWADIIA